MVGSNTPMPSRALESDEDDGDGEDRGAEHHEDAGCIVGPYEQRQAEPGHAGAAHLVDGDDEIEAGKDGTESGNEDGDAGGEDVGIEVVRRKRCGEGPARIDAAGDHGVENDAARGDVEIPAEQVDLGQRQVLGADHHGNEEISQRRGNGRHQEQEDHDDAVHGEHLVIGVGGHEVRLRREQLKADESGERSSDEEEERDRDKVEIAIRLWSPVSSQLSRPFSFEMKFILGIRAVD